MHYFLHHHEMKNLLSCLQELGYICHGPQVQNNTIVFDELQSIDQLPWGVRDIQEPGKYRLEQTNKKEAFAWANGPQAIKPLLFKSRETVWTVERDANGKLCFNPAEPTQQPIALIGARSCDLAGMAVQDKVFIEDQHKNQHYEKRRKNLFIVAVNCGYSSQNCFCVSTNTGPKCQSGYDISLTEIEQGFVAESGTDSGKKIMDRLKLPKATNDQITQGEERVKHAANSQTKAMPKNNARVLRDLLLNNLDHEQWDDVANRCLSCGNCTSVCPTCFCHHETETPSVDGKFSEHQREWDSCFSAGHSYIHNTVIRDDTKSRYKQWLTHKVGTWWDQFDMSGCIGCGRCITWCPVGIDITEEVSKLIKDEDE